MGILPVTLSSSRKVIQGDLENQISFRKALSDPYRIQLML